MVRGSPASSVCSSAVRGSPASSVCSMDVPSPNEMDIYLTTNQITASQLDVYLGDMDIRQICPTLTLNVEGGVKKELEEEAAASPGHPQGVPASPGPPHQWRRTKSEELDHHEAGQFGSSNLWGYSSDSEVIRLTGHHKNGEQVKNKTKPAPLDLPSDPHFALTPPYTGTPRYLWTPTKSSASTFFSPEPRKIRVGKEYQADIPQLVSSSDAPAPEEPMDGLLTPVYTPPIELEDEKNREKFLKDTIPVYPDTEYLHHCVHFTGGDLKEAARLARCPIQSKLADHHPLHKYRYSGQYKWTNDDQERFLLLFQRLGRNLSQIAKWMPDKKLSDIVEYYYFWKVRNPDVYKLWRNQSNCRLAQPPEFDPKPAKPSRTRNKKEIVYFETEAYTTHDSNGNKEIKFRQKKVVNPYSGSSPRPRSNKPPNPQPLGSYKCKVCGKEFQKVKSRSAHMKTHKRQQNAAAGMLPTQTLLQQQYQLQSQQHLHQQLQQQLKHLQHPDLVASAGATGSQLDVHLSHDMMTSRASGTQSTVTMTPGSDVTRTSKAKRGQT